MVSLKFAIAATPSATVAASSGFVWMASEQGVNFAGPADHEISMSLESPA
jgi:hypothetical protein